MEGALRSTFGASLIDGWDGGREAGCGHVIFFFFEDMVGGQ